MLSEGYTDYRDRAWCHFEVVASVAATNNWGRVPRTSNIHFFADQESVKSELRYLNEAMFETAMGQESNFLTAHSMRYKPDMAEVELIAAIFHHRWEPRIGAG